MQETTTPQNQNNIGIPLIIGAVVILAILAFAFMRSNDTTMDETAPTPTIAMDQTIEEGNVKDFIADDNEEPDEEVEGVIDEPSDATGEMKTFSLEAGSFYYAPNVIQVKKGDTVKVTLSGKDMMHNFVLEEFNVESGTVRTDETTEFEFVADQVGEFEFYCGIGQHKANGQVGTLIVEE